MMTWQTAGMSEDAIAADYEALPTAIQAALTLHEYRWLSSDERSALTTTETEPDHFPE